MHAGLYIMGEVRVRIRAVLHPGPSVLHGRRHLRLDPRPHNLHPANPSDLAVAVALETEVRSRWNISSGINVLILCLNLKDRTLHDVSRKWCRLDS